MGKSQATPRWIVLVATCVLFAAACGADTPESSEDAGPPAEGMLSGPREACVGSSALFKLEFPEGASASNTIGYNIWLAGERSAADEIEVTATSYGEAIRVRCNVAGDVSVRAKGPNGDYHSEVLVCMNCGAASP